MANLSKPEANEFEPFYKTYTDLIEGDVVVFLEKQILKFNDICNTITEAQSFYQYEAEKWSIKELLGHCIDTERIMAYRLLRISKNDKTELAGFDENEYVRQSGFNNRSWESLMEEFNAVRNANMFLIKSLTEAQSLQMGTANQLPISARALVYIIAGHLEHHLGILIRRYLK